MDIERYQYLRAAELLIDHCTVISAGGLGFCSVHGSVTMALGLGLCIMLLKPFLNGFVFVILARCIFMAGMGK